MDSIEPSQVFSQSSRRQRTPLLLAAATGSSRAVLASGWLSLDLPGVRVYSVVRGKLGFDSLIDTLGTRLIRN